MLIEIELEYFQTVYLKTDPDQLPRQVTGMEIQPGHIILYGLNCGTIYSQHYREEISLERDEVKATT